MTPNMYILVENNCYINNPNIIGPFETEEKAKNEALKRAKAIIGVKKEFEIQEKENYISVTRIPHESKVWWFICEVIPPYSW